MSKRRKHVVQEHLESIPLPSETKLVGQVVESRGSNIMEIKLADGNSILATIPAKMNKKIWMRRGDFVLIEMSRLQKTSGKVLGNIVNCLTREQIQHIKANDLWPAAFEDEDEEDEEEDDDEIFVNRNHVYLEDSEDESDEDEDEEDDEDDEGDE